MMAATGIEAEAAGVAAGDMAGVAATEEAVGFVDEAEGDGRIVSVLSIATAHSKGVLDLREVVFHHVHG